VALRLCCKVSSSELDWWWFGAAILDHLPPETQGTACFLKVYFAESIWVWRQIHRRALHYRPRAGAVPAAMVMKSNGDLDQALEESSMNTFTGSPNVFQRFVRVKVAALVK